MAGRAPNPRLTLFDRYQMPDDGGNCGPLRRLSNRRGGRGGRGRCRMISKTRDRATGYELLQNKMKKWIDRKVNLMEEMTDRSQAVFSNGLLYFEENFNNSYEDFVDFMMHIVLSVVIFPDSRDNIMRELLRLSQTDDRIVVADVHRRLIALLASIPTEEQFFNYNHLTNPKSFNMPPCDRAGDNRIRIRSDRGRHQCILAYRRPAQASGFEQYTDYLLDMMTDHNPINIFFDKAKYDLVTDAAIDVFGEIDRWPLDDLDSDGSGGGADSDSASSGGGGGADSDSSSDDEPGSPRPRSVMNRRVPDGLGMRYSTRNRSSRTRSQTERACRISGSGRGRGNGRGRGRGRR
jgi:hypothetical protein